MYKKFDTWMSVGHGMAKTLEEGTALLKGLEMFFQGEYLLEGFERIGCAYRIQISTEEETAKRMAEKFGREFEPTRGFIRENCG